MLVLRLDLMAFGSKDIIVRQWTIWPIENEKKMFHINLVYKLRHTFLVDLIFVTNFKIATKLNEKCHNVVPKLS